MNNSTFNESIIEQVTVTAALVVAALMTLSQLVGFF